MDALPRFVSSPQTQYTPLDMPDHAIQDTSDIKGTIQIVSNLGRGISGIAYGVRALKGFPEHLGEEFKCMLHNNLTGKNYMS